MTRTASSRLLASLAALLLAVACVALVHPAPAVAYPITTVSGIPDGWATDVTFVLTPDYTDTVETFYWFVYPSGEGPRNDYIGPVTVSVEGTTVLRFYSKDTHTDHEDPQTAYIRIDRTAPVSTIQGLPTGWMAPGVYGFTIAAVDTCPGVARTLYRLNGGTAQEYSGGTVLVIASDTTWIDYWSVDVAGNVEAPRTAVIRVDKGRPITTIAGLPPAWSAGDVVFTLSGESPRGSVTATYYRLGAGGAVTYGGPATVSAEGITTVTFNSVDSAGAVEESRTAQVRIDRSAPSSSVSGASPDWTPGTTLSFSGSDPLSGLASIRYRLGGGGILTFDGTPLAMTNEGETSVEWWAIDRAGNTEASHSALVRVDRSAPFTVVSGIPATSVSGPVTFSLSAIDAYSGVAHTYHRIDGGAQQEGTTGVVTALGPHSLEFWSTDAAGNIEMPHRTVSFAVTALADASPVTTHTVVPATPGGWAGWYVATPTVTITRDIAGRTYFGSGDAASFSWSAESPFHPGLDQGEKTYGYFGVSSLGVTEAPAHSFIVKLDTRPPSVTDDAVSTYTGSATIVLTAVDPAPGAGVADVFWSLDGLANSGATVTTSVGGHHTLKYAPVDKAGNYGELKTVSFDVTGGVALAPITTHTVVPATPGGWAGWYVATPTVTISRDIPGLTYFKSASAADFAPTPSSPFTPDLLQGDTTYGYFGVSSLGVTETPAHSFTVKLDTRAPSTTDDAVASYVDTASITLTALDPAPGSGVSVTSWSLDSLPGSGPIVTTSVTGSHVLTYASLDNAGNSEGLKTVSFTVTGGVAPSSETTRVSGADRYEVARNLAIEAFPGLAGTTHVIIACGSDRAIADPLSAAGLAGVYNAPVLLVQNDTRVVVPPATISTLAAMKSANGPLSIHIVGGTASVTAGHIAALRVYGTIDRIGGADRYAVAAGVAARMRSALGGAYPKTALVANGNMAAYFFNALAASPVAVRGHFPILLVKNGSVPPATASALGSYVTRYVIGDSSAVNATAYMQAGGTSRLGGADRFALAVSVAEHFTASGPLTWSHVVVAARLPDALTGGASLGLLGGPILFTDPSSLPAATGDTLAAHKDAIETLYLLGGTGSITPAAEAQIRARLGL